MGRGRFLALLALIPLAACASVPRGVAGLRVEQRAAEGLIRIVNDGPRDLTLYYTNHPPFTSSYNMFKVRFRDGAGRVLDGDNWVRGWWTATMSSSELVDRSAGPPPRRPLTIPARGHIDMRRDMDLLTVNRRQTDSVVGPCEMQVMLSVHPGTRWSDRRIEVLSEWAPEPCPTVNAWR
jgi:hypothetical protein